MMYINANAVGYYSVGISKKNFVRSTKSKARLREGSRNSEHHMRELIKHGFIDWEGNPIFRASLTVR